MSIKEQILKGILEFFDQFADIIITKKFALLLPRASSNPELQLIVYRVYDIYMDCTRKFIQMYSPRHSRVKRKLGTILSVIIMPTA